MVIPFTSDLIFAGKQFSITLHMYAVERNSIWSCFKVYVVYPCKQ